MERFLQNVQYFPRAALSRLIQPGDTVVDATVGRGRDTLFLAECVGAQGRVYGFDIQEEALVAAKEALEREGLMERVFLISQSHALLQIYVQGPVKAVMFNLGYLPGGDRTIVTQGGDTVESLRQALAVLTVSGLITITLYPGHEGGREEADEVEAWAGELPKRKFSVWRGVLVNQGPRVPYWLMLQKNKE